MASKPNKPSKIEGNNEEFDDDEQTASINDISLHIDVQNDSSILIHSKFACLEKQTQVCIKKGIKLGLAQTVVQTEIYDDKNQKIFQAKEQLDQPCVGCCYSPDRWLDMNVIDLQGEEILHLSRDKGSSCSWVSCNLPTSEIILSPRFLLAKMKGVNGIYPIKYNVEDETGDCILKIRSGFSFPYLYFNIFPKDKSCIMAKISRERPESHHVLSRNYSVHLAFQIDLTLKMKTVLLGVALLLMASHFEESE